MSARRQGWNWHERWEPAPSRSNMTRQELDEWRAYLVDLARQCEAEWDAINRREEKAKRAPNYQPFARASGG